MSLWLQRQWYRMGIWHLLLIPFSLLFWGLVSLRQFAYKTGLFKSYRLAVPVIMVGNISVGGTGKTPLVIWLVEQLRQAGWQPAIISRGYGARQPNANKQQPRAVKADSECAHVGDEPLLMARRLGCPVWVCVDRVAAGQALLQAHPECDVLVSDDGLQHYRLQRDVEIAVVDAGRGHGNGWLLPAGPLREPTSRLKGVDAVVGNGSLPAGLGKQASYIMRLMSASFNNVLHSQQTASAQDFMGQELHAVAGIGNPERFFQQLESLGLQIHRHAFADHHAFAAQDLVFSSRDLQTGSTPTILMTEKDAVKCQAFASKHWWYLPINATIEGDLLGIVLAKLKPPAKRADIGQAQ